MNFTRPCPACHGIITYRSKYSMWRAADEDSKCLWCANPRRLSPSTVRRLLSLAKQGLTPINIARTLGMSATCVNGYMTKAGYDTSNRLRSPPLLRYMAVCHNGLRARARKAGIRFTLSVDDIYALYLCQGGKCFYTDVRLDVGLGQGTRRHGMSVDRIVPGRGYTRRNIVLCTRRANRIKNNLSLSELRQWVPSWYERIAIFTGCDIH